MNYRENAKSVTCKMPCAQFEDLFLITIRPNYIYAAIIYLFHFLQRNYQNKDMYFSNTN
jgi:hypothetical protein